MKIFRKLVASASLAGALALSAPAFAQDEAPSQDEQVLAEMMAMFQTEPLTPEQEARLPLAGEVIDRMMPPGTLGEVMGQMFDGMLGPLMQRATEPKAADFAGQLGLETWEIDMDEAAITEAATIVDPLRDERNERTAAVFPEIMTEMMNAMEPTMRKVMTEVYAVYFNEAQLNDINAFFATDSGSAFAKSYMTMSSDPRVIGGMMEAMPQMMGAFENMETRLADATADMPEPRGFADLSAAEQARIAELTGYSVEELAERAAETAEATE
ncbi:DUF2059 domain-containing protein [Altererythrobacter lutimaris]|uniref:DUF2059 domain-containing protein n=1 Tax=Altererythrobacter lutimaris TaxID=2743979 RepID=A0A850HDM6_9SPHN|nr:DUF2059 domain-containing protein [Altererythrobacter lutimaris]NVE95505.1 DUF2059 domain-containing protein [Altererythrobacter lutimaris]